MLLLAMDRAPDELKRCYKCARTQPVSSFAADKTRRDGRAAQCRDCISEYRQANKVRISANAKIYGSTKGKEYRLRNADVINGKQRERWRKNPDLLRARVADWKRRNPAKVAALRVKWVNENRAKKYASNAQYRAGRLRATPSWANPEKMLAIYEEAQRISAETGIPHHVDHIVPLKSKIVCGLHCEANLQILPGIENLSKSNLTWPNMPSF